MCTLRFFWDSFSDVKDNEICLFFNSTGKDTLYFLDLFIIISSAYFLLISVRKIIETKPLNIKQLFCTATNSQGQQLELFQDHAFILL